MANLQRLLLGFVAALAIALHGCRATEHVGPAQPAPLVPVVVAPARPRPVEPPGAPVLVPQLSGHVRSAVVSPDGRLLVATTWRGLYVVDLSDKRTRGFLPLVTARGVAFSSDSATVFVGDTASSVLHVWHLGDDTVREVPLPEPSAWLSPGTSATQVLARSGEPSTAIQIVDAARGTVRTLDVGKENAPLDQRVTQEGVAIHAGQRAIIVARPGHDPSRFDLPFVAAGAQIDRSGKFAFVLNKNASRGDLDIVVDLSTMRERASRKACGQFSKFVVTPDAARVIITCSLSRSIVVATLPDLQVEREGVFDNPATFLGVAGDWLVAGDGATHKILRFKLGDTGRNFAWERFLEDGRPFDVAAAGALYRATEGRVLVVDAGSGGTLFEHVGAPNGTGFHEAKNGVLTSARSSDFDIQRRATTLDRVTDDGSATYVLRGVPSSPTAEYVFTKRDGSNETWTLPSSRLPERPSARGSFVLAASIDLNEYCGFTSFVGRHGERGRTPCQGSFVPVVSPREDVIATQGGCSVFAPRSVDSPCKTIDLTPLDGGAVVHIEAVRPTDQLSFSSDGAMLVAGDTVYDVAKRSVSWQLGENEHRAWVPEGWNVVVVPVDPDTDHASLRFAHPRTGATLGAAQFASVDATSPRGAFALLRDHDQLALLDARTFAVTKLGLRASRVMCDYVGDDGRFVWFSVDDTRFAYRISDGRLLAYVACADCANPELVGLLTDEGVVDRPRAPSTFAVRVGPSVLPRGRASALTSADAFPEGLVRPTLEEDFFAEREVSPRQ